MPNVPLAALLVSLTLGSQSMEAWAEVSPWDEGSTHDTASGVEVPASRAGGSDRKQEATVMGRVTDRRSLRPVAGVQVDIPQLERGTITGADGRYILSGIPAGTHELRAQLIGYRPVEEIVTVETGASVVVNFELTEQALAMDEIIVTGTVGGTRARSIGNVVTTMDAAGITEVAPVSTVQQLLNARAAGVSVMPLTGNVGTGAQVRIRGTSSLSLTNQPLIYVDGVRINNSMGMGPNLRSGRQVSRIEDINPDDIERIEVIKGPAAATLYGTEASGGVIQIVTKQGVSGDPVFEARVRQGTNWLSSPAQRYPGIWGFDPNTGEVVHANLIEQEAAAGRPVFEPGRIQSYGASMRGGTDRMRYYIASDWGDTRGVVPYNWQRRFSGRVNLEIPGDRYQVQMNVTHMNIETSLAEQASGWGIIDQIVWGTVEQLDGRTRGFLRVTPEAISDIEAIDENVRTVGGIQISHNPTSWLNHRLSLGLDRGDEANWTLFPRHPTGTDYFFGGQSLGEKTMQRIRSDYLTFDYGASAAFQATADIELQTAAGVQFYRRWHEIVDAAGREFPAPSVRTLGGAAVTSSSESIIENKTLGVYVQQQISRNDRLFLTAAIRGDDNSAFGADFDAAIYPKVSVAWVINEEPFWNIEAVNTLRLRGAWGRAGQQPDVFAAVRLYAPGTGPGNVSVLTPHLLGNPELGPEVGEELELGFDMAVFNDRVSGAFTYYHQRTRDAIVERPVPPSRGFPGIQFVNIGEVKNTGLELNIDSRIIDRPSISWDLGTRLASNSSEIVDLGGLPPISFGPGQEHREGFPVAAFFARRVVQAELDQDGSPINVLCDGGPDVGGEPVPCDVAPRVFWGQPHPTLEAALSTEVTMWRNLRLYALAELRTGHHRFDWDIRFRHLLFLNTEASVMRDEPILEAYRHMGDVNQSGYMKAGFAKLREVSATYTVPQRWAGRIGASRAVVSASVRNPTTLWFQQSHIFRDRVADPELRNPGPELIGGGHTLFPPLSQFILTTRLTF